MSDQKNELVDRVMNRGIIVDAIPSLDDFKKKLLSGEKMRFYIGADPTSTALHLSHAKNYMLLEEFRQLGHEVIVLVGDFTARIGDPTDKTTARKQLSREDVLKNVDSWMKQIRPLMDFDAKENPPLVKYNHDWLSPLTFEDVIKLASNFTVQQMLERDMFEKRIKEEKPIFMHEFFYPLMQGYDSVAMDVDVELCGTDQTFNALAGRTLQKRMNNKEKFVVVVNLMENPVTGELMSKSKGTGVFLDSSPFDMYGSIMSQPDEMIKILLINNTRVELDEVEKIAAMENPRDAKMITAFEITKIFHGEDEAKKAQENFVSQIQNKEVPDDMLEIEVSSGSNIFDAVVTYFDGKRSKSEVRRLFSQNAIAINGDKESDTEKEVSDADVFKVGKRDWFKTIVK